MTQIPSGWSALTLGGVRQDRSSRVVPAETPDEVFELFSIPSFPSGAAEVIRGAEIGSDKQSVEPGTVLVSKINPRINRVWVVRPRTAHRVIASTEWVTFAPVDAVMPEYLAYYLRRDDFRNYLATNVSGVGGSLMRVRPVVVDRYPLVLAPLSEQRRIVAALDEHLSDLDAAVAGLERAQINLRRYRESVLATALAEAGAAHDWVTLESILSREPRSLQSGPFGSNLLHSEFQEQGVLAIGIDNVGKGVFLAGRQHRISQGKYEILKKYAARPGDVLITVMATIGRCCVVPDDLETAIITKHVYRITLDRDQVVPKYLMYCILGSLAVREQLFGQAHGQTRLGLNSGILRGLSIPRPPLTLQQEIVRIADDCLYATDLTAADLDVQLARAVRLRQAILTRAFEGRLVSNDPNDESASELLMRLRDQSALTAAPVSGSSGGRARPTARRGRA